MNHFIYLILTCCAISLVLSCTKEDAFTANNEKTIDVRTPEDKVDVCHLTGSGEYITININANALDAHLAHGDTEGECTNCDQNSCLFCDKLDYFDFDEPCDLSYWHTDYYCQGEEVQGNTIRGWAALQDYDPSYGDCPPDPEGENDDGWVWAYYSKNAGCGEWFGLVAWYYYNENDDFYDSGLFEGNDSIAYAQAAYCAGAIGGFNAGLETPLVNNNCGIYYDCGNATFEIANDRLESSLNYIISEDPTMEFSNKKKIAKGIQAHK